MRTFIKTAVARKQLGYAYTLVDRDLKGAAVALKQWESGNITVIQYEAENVNTAEFIPIYHYQTQALFNVDLIPVGHTQKRPELLFFIGMKRAGGAKTGKWLIDYWRPPAGARGSRPHPASAGTLGPAIGVRHPLVSDTSSGCRLRECSGVTPGTGAPVSGNRCQHSVAMDRLASQPVVQARDLADSPYRCLNGRAWHRDFRRSAPASRLATFRPASGWLVVPRGKPLVFQAVVKARGVTVTRNWPIVVH